MANRRFNQFFRTLHTYPVLLTCEFTVAQADTAGYGVTGLKGPGIQQVYMNTSAATPAVGNPLPQAGNIVVILQDNYKALFSSFERVQAPVTGSEVSSLTATHAYQITTLSSSTVAQWNTAGLPVGITPALGAAFIAKANIVGGGLVKAIGNSNIDSIELVGDPGKTLNSSYANIPGVQSGSYLLFQCLKSDVLTQPTDGAVIRLGLVLSNSRILNGTGQ